MKTTNWKFEKVAGPYNGPNSGLVWDGSGMLFSLVEEGRILRYDPKAKKTTQFRNYTNRITGLAFGPNGELYGGQEGGRRVIEFMSDGSARPLGTRIDGRIHNFPNDLTVDAKGRIWFADPHSTIYAFGPQIFPQLDHASVLRLERDERLSRAWREGNWHAIAASGLDTFARLPEPRLVDLEPFLGFDPGSIEPVQLELGTLDLGKATLHPAVKHIHVTEELIDEGRCRCRIDFVG